MSEQRKPSRGTWSGRRWPGFAETSGAAAAAAAQGGAMDAEIQPSVDPRTTPVPSGLEIHVLEGEDAGKTFPLETWEVVLGRRMTPEEKKTGWVLFNDPTVSRMHAVLEWRPGPRRYRLDHQSRTNPTLINGRLVQQAILYPDDTIRLGDLTFQIRVRRPPGPGEAERPQIEDKGLIYSGYKLSVVKGAEVGRQFTLEHKVIHIGGASGDVPGENWVVLEDPALPREQAFLVWYDADKKYGIFHAGTSPVPTQISRVLTASRPDGKEESRNLLQVDDVIIMGDTVLMVMKHERFQETARALRAQPDPSAEVGGSPSAGKQPAVPPPAPAAAKRKTSFDFTSGRKMLDIRPKEQEPEPEPPPPRPLVRVKGGGGAPAMPALPDRPFEQTTNWFARPDYVLEMIGGPSVGQRIALKAAALRRDRPLMLGAKGKRVNDIELEGVANAQASIHQQGGRFSLLNEAEEITINEMPLAAGESRQLKNGDEIQVGANLMLFIDRGAIERQFQFELEVVEEQGAMDKPRAYTLNQETMTIGRSKGCDVRVEDPKVSRVHAQVTFRRGGFVLEHKSETNPTFVNGVELPLGKERVLQDGDEIQVSEDSLLAFRQRRALGF